MDDREFLKKIRTLKANNQQIALTESRIKETHLDSYKESKNTESKYKVGDVVRCLPGFVNIKKSVNFGGYGYEEDKIFTVAHIFPTIDGEILWPNDGTYGVKSNAVELVLKGNKLTEDFDLINDPEKVPFTDEFLEDDEMLEIEEDGDYQNPSPDEQRDEENKFKDSVTKLCKFDKIKVYKENVKWSGNLVREKISWEFSLDDTIGCFIDIEEPLQLRDENIETIKRLRVYYDVWSDEWSGRLTGTEDEDDDADTEENSMKF